MKEIAIIIPAYKPHEQIMTDFLSELTKKFTKVVIVDDGSGEEYRSFFENLKNKGFTVLRHNVNLGKGRALKTAFNYCLNEYSDIVGTVTADCDGQHSVEDIIKCAKKLKDDPSKLVIGARNFNEDQVPFKSRYGNKITRSVLALFVGIKITDTQTGLRAFGINTMKEFLNTKGERYEYETNMLIECKEKDIQIAEVPISTIYINNNELSHFNPIKDSIMIYKLFVKYIVSALSSFLVDILLFALLVHLLPDIHTGVITSIVVATVIARVISSLYNYGVNSKLVFKNKGATSIVKYYILVIIQMFVSAFVVSELFKLTNMNSTFIKVLVDLIIFVINFFIQREWVFK